MYRAQFFLLSVFFLLLGLSDSIVFKTFAFADDSVSVFQHDVILSKQKNEAVAETLNVLPVKIESAKAVLLQTEAQRLMQELVDKNYSGSENVSASVAYYTAEKKVAEVKLNPSPTASTGKPVLKKRGGWPWLSPFAGSANEYNNISEGLAAYKVAVSDDKITLQEAREIGVAGNAALQASAKKVEVAESKLTEAKRALFPTVQGTVEYNGGLASDVPGDDTHGRFYKGKAHKINVTQPLFYGGELVFTVKQAEENVKIAKADYEKTKNDILLQTETAFYGVLKAEYNVQYQIELYEKVNGLRKRVKKEFEDKLISEVDRLNVESKYQEAYFQIESARNDLLSADLTLHQILDVDPKEPLPVDLQLHFTKVDPDFNQMLSLAFQQNPDMILKGLEVDSALWGVKIYKAKKLPRVDLRGSYGYLGEIFRDTAALEAGNADLDPEKEWFLGVTSSMPVGPNSVSYEQTKNKFGPTVIALTGSESWRKKIAFNLFDRFADITDEKSAQAALLQAEADLKKSKSDLTLKIREDFYNLQKSLIQIDSTIAKMHYQQKQNTINEYLLGLQEIPAVNYIEGIIEETQGKFSFIQAVADYNLAISDLGASIGDFDYFDRQLKTKTTQ